MRRWESGTASSIQFHFVSSHRLSDCIDADYLRVAFASSVGVLRSLRSGKPIIPCNGGMWRQKRLAECVPNSTCSPEGNMFMQYVDTLVLSVKKKELTEAEAMRRYTEYKNGGTPSHP